MSDNMTIDEHMQAVLDLIREKHHEEGQAVVIRWGVGIEMLAPDSHEPEIYTEYSDNVMPWTAKAFSWLMGKDADTMHFGQDLSED